MLIKYIGHSCFEIKGSKTLLLDPYISENPQTDITPYELKPDYILVSHGHGDHFGDALEIARAADAEIIAPNELALYCLRRGANAHPMHIGGAFDFTENLNIKLTSALHGSAFTEEGLSQYLGMPCGFLVRMDGKIIYFAGDTALTYDMKAVLGDRYDIDLALLPIGDNYTMGPEDALTAAGWLKAKKVVPMHYNTFPLIKQDGEEWCRRCEELNKGTMAFALKPGSVLEI